MILGVLSPTIIYIYNINKLVNSIYDIYVFISEIIITHNSIYDIYMFISKTVITHLYICVQVFIYMVLVKKKKKRSPLLFKHITFK